MHARLIVALQADAEASSACAQQLQSEVTDLSQQVARLEQQLAAAAANRMMLEGDLAVLRSDVRARYRGREGHPLDAKETNFLCPMPSV